MKRVIFMCVLLLGAGVRSAAVAACGDIGYDTQLERGGQDRIADALNNRRILATGGGEEWKEDHCANGALYKVGAGPTDPVDPRVFRGTWTVDGGGPNSVVVYNYTVGGNSNSTFRWKLYRNAAGGLCWENPATAQVIATAPAPGPLSGTCAIP